VAHDARLDDGDARAAGEQPIGLHARALAAAEARAVARADRPERETRPPAFCAAASAWAMKGRACCARVERMRPGRMRKSSSPRKNRLPWFVRAATPESLEARADGGSIAVRSETVLRSGGGSSGLPTSMNTLSECAVASCSARARSASPLLTLDRTTKIGPSDAGIVTRRLRRRKSHDRHGRLAVDHRRDLRDVS
jgi:hypothetical protein